MIRTRVSFLVISLATSVGLFTGTVAAQSTIYDFDKELLDILPGAGGTQWPVSGDNLGDVDSDGYGDISFSTGTSSPTVTGHAWVVSGATGLPLYERTSVGDQYWFSRAGDVNADGQNDVLSVQAFGPIEVLSGPTGTPILTLPLPVVGAKGRGIGDFNGDGYDDVALSEAQSDSPSGVFWAGNIWVYSGKDGAELLHKFGTIDRQFLGFSFDGAGDVNADGYDDLVVGSPGNTLGYDGEAFVYSGQDGSLLHKFNGQPSADGFIGLLGAAVLGPGDLDNDGFDDLVIKSSEGAAPAPEIVRAHSGQSGLVLFNVVDPETLVPHTDFARVMGDIGDTDFDGHDDFLIGAPQSAVGGAASGKVVIVSGLDGSILKTIPGKYGDRLMWGHGEDDVDGDGFRDIVSWGPKSAFGVHSGFPFPMPVEADEHLVFLGKDAQIEFNLTPFFASPGDAYFLLGSASGTTPGTLVGSFLLPLNTPDPWFTITLGSPTLFFSGSVGTLDAAGQAQATLNWPASVPPYFAGTTLHHACVTLDPVTFAVTSVSNAVPVNLVTSF